VSFLATIQPYCKDDGSVDLTLADLELVA
jgi:hypothetical protein